VVRFAKLPVHSLTLAVYTPELIVCHKVIQTKHSQGLLVSEYKRCLLKDLLAIGIVFSHILQNLVVLQSTGPLVRH
jgi:hypothetical protein